jgi:hypothetical protein
MGMAMQFDTARPSNPGLTYRLFDSVQETVLFKVAFYPSNFVHEIPDVAVIKRSYDMGRQIQDFRIGSQIGLALPAVHQFRNKMAIQALDGTRLVYVPETIGTVTANTWIECRGTCGLVVKAEYWLPAIRSLSRTVIRSPCGGGPTTGWKDEHQNKGLPINKP